MKISFLAFVILLFSANDCSNHENQNINSISYETFTRGSSTVYKISNRIMKITSTGVNKSESSKELSSEEWKMLVQELEEVKVSKINQLKTSTDERASDAALHAILSVRKNDTIYKTNSFDHGNAPKEINPLVEAILRLAENVE